MLSKEDAKTDLTSWLLHVQIPTNYIFPIPATRRLSCVRNVFLVISYWSIPLNSGSLPFLDLVSPLV
jgi:hypothetical protein